MTKVIAHRGSKGTHPENTIAAFLEAVDCQCDGIELDVQYTKDKALVVIHDNSVDRTTNGRGEVDHLTLQEIQQLDAGSWFDEIYRDQRVPLLTEVLELLKGREFKGLLNIEIKTDEKPYMGIEEDLVKVMQSQPWPFDYLYSSFNLASLELAQQLDPTAPKAYIIGVSPKKIKQARGLSFISAIHPKIEWVKAQGEQISAYPKAVRPWTVNDELDMQDCFRKKIAGIHTDYPREAMRYRRLMYPNLSYGEVKN